MLGVQLVEFSEAAAPGQKQDYFVELWDIGARRNRLAARRLKVDMMPALCYAPWVTTDAQEAHSRADDVSHGTAWVAPPPGKSVRH